MHTRKRFPFLTSLAFALTGVLSMATGHANVPRCVVPNLTDTPAHCMFDVWGFVYGPDGTPLPGAYVQDGIQISYADATGFYRMRYVLPGEYEISAHFGSDPECRQYKLVTTGLSAVTEGGTRQDFRLPCAR